MFNLSGLFTTLACLACAAGGVLGVVLKLCGVLLLGWGWIALPFVAAVVFALLSANGVG